MFSVARRGSAVDRRELAREVESISEGNRRYETFRHCPKCGAGRFTQHAVRGEQS